MTREQALSILAAHTQKLQEFGVASLSLFGSVARNEATEDSDVDILVEFNRPVGLFVFVRLRRRLQEILGRGVDLVTPDALKAPLRERILKEAVHAA